MPVIMSKSYGAPEVTKDGYKVVNQLKPEDEKVANFFCFNKKGFNWRQQQNTEHKNQMIKLQKK